MELCSDVIVVFFAAAFVAEKYLLGHMNVGTYMVVGWSFQTLAMVIMAGSEWKQLGSLKRKVILDITNLGIQRTLAGVTIVYALSKVDAGLLSGIRTYKIALVFIGGWLFLHERDHLRRKFVGAVLATMGLWMLFS